MNPEITQDIYAIVSIFTHFAGADTSISDEEILFIFAAVLKYYKQFDKIDLTVKISEFMDDPLPLREAIDIIKEHPQFALSLMLQSALLISLDRDIDFFEETILYVVSKELFGVETAVPIETLITQLKQSFENNKTQNKDNEGGLDWV